MDKKSTLELYLIEGMEKMAENIDKTKGPSRLDKMVDKVQSLIDIFKNLDNGKAISAIARDEVFGVKVIYLFSQADNNIYLDRKGHFNEVSRFAQSKDGIETRTTKEIVSKYGVKSCCESLTSAAKRFRDVEMDIATYGNPATVVSGVHAAARP